MLNCEGISLIPIENEDLEILNKWKNDEEVFKYLGGGYRPTSKTQQEKWIDALTSNTFENQRYLILDEENKKVGFIGLYDIFLVNGTASLGIYIGEKESWGKGIASRAYKALERYAKMYLNLKILLKSTIRKTGILYTKMEKLASALKK